MSNNDDDNLPEKYQIKTIMKSHTLEELFNIEENTTELVKKEIKTELIKHEEFDQKDQEIEQQIQQIYDKSLEMLSQQEEASVDLEPKYIARNNEVKNMILNTALNALKEKINLKQHKDKLTVAKEAVKKQNIVNKNNIVITDRNNLLKSLFNQNSNEKIIDQSKDDNEPE